MVRFLHTSDWQIGMKGGGLGQAGARVAKTRIETIDHVLSIAAEHNVDFVVASGDLFEDNRVSYSDVEQVARIIRAHPEINIHAIPGNHDLPGPGSVWNRPALRGIPNLAVHLDETPVEVCQGVILHPFPVVSRYTSVDPLAQLPDLATQPGIHIAMAHGHITTAQFPGAETGITLPIDPAHVERCGLDYLALGHWHGTRLIDARDGGSRIAYSGTHEQTAYDETDAGNVLIVEIEGKGAWPHVEKIRSGQLRWGNERLEFVGDANLDRLNRLLTQADFNLLRLELSGELPESLYPEYAELLEKEHTRFLDLRVRDQGLRWRTDAAALLPLTDASLVAVVHRLQALAAAGTVPPETVREAIRLLGKFAAEAEG